MISKQQRHIITMLLPYDWKEQIIYRISLIIYRFHYTKQNYKKKIDIIYQNYIEISEHNLIIF